ncbi:LuxR family transcriptional regulator [Amycolatopsis thermoflava]|uniref:LuxR family maltose regulon positive regulatory protein n=1 Tax=Amycolatopsis thermoflava TaxID=84480 RepID=A0A3N2H5X1_9PSEU|nr:LuxR family transcriptional regulator [Amycolatopsis thermoflava]ROS44314.1 LuxR family maltose regulon positive regulatory protein [Amycolatopsis thermoflava]
MTAPRRRPAVVVRTRLRPPAPHPDDVRRTRLLARLDAAGEQVILVAAPRGAGKTVLLAQWVAARRCAWVSLSSRDDTPAGVWSAVLESVRPHCDDVPAPSAALLDDETTLFTEIIPGLLNSLASAGPLVLVLDGLDVVEHAVTRAALDEFVRRAPDAVRVVLATARPPTGPVAALRAAGRLTELTEEDLRFDLAETRQLLSAAAGRPVEQSEAAALWHAYAGWATGLRLAGMALRNQPPGTALAHPVPSVEEFFRAEVLERVTSRQRRLLLYSSVLTELTPERCAEVTALPAAGETLSALAASSLLLRRTGSGLRCHPVLRLVLSSVLAAEHPDAVAVLHTRAAERLRKEGDPDAAYEHARLAGLPDVAVRTVIETWPAAHPRTLLARLDEVPAMPAEAHAIAAAAELACGRPARAATRLPSADDGPALAVRAWLALHGGDLAAAQRDATRAIATRLPAGARPWWLLLARAALGTARVWEGQAADVVDQLAATASEAEGIDYRDVAVRAMDARTAGLLLTGDATAALAAARRAVALHELDPMRCTPPVVAVACLANMAGADRGRMPPPAATLVPSAPHAEAFSALLHAHPASPSADARRRRKAHAQARAALAGLRYGPVLAGLFEEQWPIPDLRPAVLSDRERAVLRALSGPLTLREIAAELHVSRNTVKTHVRSVFRKLGAHDRADAVSRAAAAGIATAGTAPGAGAPSPDDPGRSRGGARPVPAPPNR